MRASRASPPARASWCESTIAARFTRDASSTCLMPRRTASARSGLSVRYNPDAATFVARRRLSIVEASVLRQPMIRLPRFYTALVWAATLALALASTAPHAQLTIEIIGGGGTTVPIAIVPFAGEANYPYPLTGIVGADLARSGLFKLIDPAGVNPRPARADDVRFGEWT